MELATLIASLLGVGAIPSTRFAQYFGVPILVLFVGVGMLAGSSGPLGIVFANYSLGYNAGLLALAVILFSGDSTLRPLSFARRSFRPACCPRSGCC